MKLRSIFLTYLLLFVFSQSGFCFDYYLVSGPDEFEPAGDQQYPAHYETYIDVAYGTTIRRFTDEPEPPADAGVRTNYVAKQHSIENSDGTLIYVAARGKGAGAIFTSSDGVYRTSIDLYNDAYDNFCWSSTTANEGYLLTGGTAVENAVFYRVRIDTNTWAISYEELYSISSTDFPDENSKGETYVKARIHDESPTSWDGRHWAVIAQYSGDAGNENLASYLAWFDKDLHGVDSPGIRGVVGVPGNIVYNTGMSPGGNYIFFRSYENTDACSSGTCVWRYAQADFDGVVDWQADGHMLAEQGMGYHYALAYDDLGNEVYVTNYSTSYEYYQVAYWIFNNPGDQNRVVVANRTDWRPATGGSGFGDSHVGTVGVAPGAREWIAILPTDSNGDGKDECGYEEGGASTISFAKLSAADKVIWRVAHARNDAGSYIYQLFSGASRDGQSFYYNSNWCNQSNSPPGAQMQLFRAELPTNWWADIGTVRPPGPTGTKNFLTSYSFDDGEAEFIASNYDFLVTKLEEASAVQSIKAANPGIKTIHYDNALTYGDDHFVYDTVTGDKIVHDDWGWYLHDISNAAYREALATNIAENLDAFTQFDGVFLDDCKSALVAAEFHREGSDDDPQLPTDLVDNWQTHMASLIQEIKTAIQTKLLILNCGWHATNYLQHADGQMDENFGHANWQGPSDFLDVASWKNHIAALENASRASKYYLAQSGISDGATQGEADKIFRYTFCSFLMGVVANNNYAKHSFAPSLIYADLYYDEAWEAELGPPSGNYFAIPGTTDIYRRDFENGCVIVNPTDASTMAIDLGSSFFTSDGVSISTVQLEPRDGLILFNEDAGTNQAPPSSDDNSGDSNSGGCFIDAL